MTRSYDPASFHRDLSDELRRLRGQVELSWDRERRALSALGAENVSRIVELGSGPGFYTVRLRELFPGVSITCVDANPALIAAARGTLAAAPAGQVRFVEALADETGLADGSFDLAVARLLFQHLSDPAATAREMHRLLAPGGWAVVVDVDKALDFVIDPEPAGLHELMAGLAKSQAQRGGDRSVGRKLIRILRGAGFADLRFELLPLHSDELGKAAFADQLDPAPLRPLIQAGLLTPEQFAAIEAGTRTVLEDDRTFFWLTRVFAAGRKGQG